MSNRLAIVRAAHLHEYLVVMREFGAPVSRDLARSRLPPMIEDTPDLYVSVSAAIRWIGECGHDVEPMELGFLAARSASLASLKPAHQAAIIGAQTGFNRLRALLRIANIEDSGFRATIREETDQVRVCCDVDGLKSHPFHLLCRVAEPSSCCLCYTKRGGAHMVSARDMFRVTLPYTRGRPRSFPRHAHPGRPAEYVNSGRSGKSGSFDGRIEARSQQSFQTIVIE